MRKFLGLLLVPFFCLIFLTSVTHAHADTLINVTNIVWSSCSPDCRSLRIYYDNFPAQGMGLLNVDANSGAYGATSFTTTYADFNIPNNNPPWDYNMELTSSNGGVSRVIHLIPSFTGDAFNSQFASAVINQGDTWSYTGSFTPADYSTSWTATVDYGDGSGAQPLTLSGTNFSLSHVYTNNGTYTVTVSVTDNQKATGTGTATVTVNNIAPIVGTITAPSSPVLVNTAITASASFTDADVSDTHTASWNWGDGNTTTGTVTESNGSGSVSNTHTYTATGVYLVTLTVTDNTGLQGTSTFQYIAVYDASTSFAGGRSFDN